MLSIDGAGVSHVGLVRADNEDSAFVGPSLVLVADGVGGGPGGEIASATTTYAVSATALSDPAAEPVAALARGVALAESQLAAGVGRDPSLAGMATTLTALLTDGESFALAHLGDSRGYRYRDGELVQLTRDHTYVQTLVDQGHLSPEEVGRHPWRNVVLRSVGSDADDLGDIGVADVRAGDRLLLASDGLTDLVSAPTLAEVLEGHDDQAAADRLVSLALAAGGRDNITCVVVTIVDRPRLVGDGQLLGAVREPGNLVDPAAAGPVSA